MDDSCNISSFSHIFLFLFYSDGKLDLDEFRLICRALFRNDKGKIYTLEEEKLKDVFEVFDQNGDEFIDKDEFVFCWNHWIKVVSLKPTPPEYFN